MGPGTTKSSKEILDMAKPISGCLLLALLALGCYQRAHTEEPRAPSSKIPVITIESPRDGLVTSKDTILLSWKVDGKAMPPVKKILHMELNDIVQEFKGPNGTASAKVQVFRAKGVTFVKQGAKGKGDGTSWDDAFTDLKLALAKTRSGEIWVAAGTYKPDLGTNSIDSTFSLDSNISLSGGFEGKEQYRIQAKPNMNLTVLSGDIGKSGDKSDNSRTVVTVVGKTSVDGFHITDGNSPDYNAGGMMSGGNLDLSRCVFSNNHSTVGPGALSAYRGNPYIHESIFLNNSGQNGGAIYARGNATIANCVFHSNTSDRWGGGILFYAADQGVLANCTFSGNHAPKGSAVLVVAAEEPVHSKMEISNSIFWNNRNMNGKDPDDSEIFIDQITKDNSVGLTVQNCIIKGGANPDSSGLRIKDRTRTYTEILGVKRDDPHFLSNRDWSDVKGPDKKYFTPDDGLNTPKKSPAIDAGTLVPFLSIDILGKERAQGKAADIGAYEQ